MTKSLCSTRTYSDVGKGMVVAMGSLSSCAVPIHEQSSSTIVILLLLVVFISLLFLRVRVLEFLVFLVFLGSPLLWPADRSRAEFSNSRTKG